MIPSFGDTSSFGLNMAIGPIFKPSAEPLLNELMRIAMLGPGLVRCIDVNVQRLLASIGFAAVRVVAPDVPPGQ